MQELKGEVEAEIARLQDEIDKKKSLLDEMSCAQRGDAGAWTITFEESSEDSRGHWRRSIIVIGCAKTIDPQWRKLARSGRLVSVVPL